MIEIKEIRDSSYLHDVCSVIKRAHEAEYYSTGLTINTSDITEDYLYQQIMIFDGVCLIGVIDGVIVGTCSIFREPKYYWFSSGVEGGGCTIKYVAVDPKYQGKHIASEILEYSKRIVRKENSLLMVSTDQRNKHAVNLYKKNGFILVDVTRGKKAESNAVRFAWWPNGCPFSKAKCFTRVIRGKMKCLLKKLIRF